jgi:hypothetical protein
MCARVALAALVALGSLSAARVCAQATGSEDPGASALGSRAWGLFLADRSAEAASAYVAVLDGGPEAERPDALVMLAAILADVDWDRDGHADQASPVARVADPAIVPQDRAWLPSLAWATAHALWLASRDSESIAVAA